MAPNKMITELEKKSYRDVDLEVINLKGWMRTIGDREVVFPTIQAAVEEIDRIKE